MNTAAAQPDAVRDAVARVWARRRSEIVTRVILIERASDAAAAGELGEELRAAAEDAAHKLAGGAATFGFAAAAPLPRSFH